MARTVRNPKINSFWFRGDRSTVRRAWSIWVNWVLPPFTRA